MSQPIKADTAISINTKQPEDSVPTQMETSESSEGGEDPPLRASNLRPALKLSVNLIDTYKYINKLYYEAKAKRLRESNESHRGGVHNNGYDDQNYDYILRGDEIFNNRYVIKYKMGKGSFGQVVCAYDQEQKCEVAIKVIKSRKPFLVQAQTEIEILTKILDSDPTDERHLVRLHDHFVHRDHQCLVFEILSFNLYELLRNTKFRGVSLNLVRKFSVQLLRALELLNKVNIIHCDLKPENILLRHPRRSAIKLIDFGSSCYLSKRSYTYIQSRFYRSPEVLLGLPYTQKIDMWSLGCVAYELHVGEPLFAGSNQVEQLCRIVDILGLPPLEMIKSSPEKTRNLFFEKTTIGMESTLSSVCDLNNVIMDDDSRTCYVLKRPNKNLPAPRKLQDVLGVYSGGPGGRRLNEAGHEPSRYEQFLDFISQMLVYDPQKRAGPTELMRHPYIAVLMDEVDPVVTLSVPSSTNQSSSGGTSLQSTISTVPSTAATTTETSDETDESRNQIRPSTT
eukprot:gene2125-2319_t